MAPVIKALQKRSHLFDVVTVVTGQHREMLRQVLGLFDIVPDDDLDIMRETQSLTDITTRCLVGLESVFFGYQPDLVFVHGDTTTTLAAALAAYYQQIPVGHVEAGLRTYDRYQPFPEEMNRVLTDHLSELHFAPTWSNQQQLEKEGAKRDTIFVTGNTAIDALLAITSPDHPFTHDSLRARPWKDRALILCDVHRRENFGRPLSQIARGLRRLVAAHPDSYLVLSVHPNPAVREVMESVFSSQERVLKIAPLDYADWANLMNQARFIVTDSGGLQEEAPALGVPVLLARKKTERPEAVAAGTVKLVGTDEQAVFDMGARLLTEDSLHKAMASRRNPYGDGRAADRIVQAVAWYWGKGERPLPPFSDSPGSPSEDLDSSGALP